MSKQNAQLGYWRRDLINEDMSDREELKQAFEHARSYLNGCRNESVDDLLLSADRVISDAKRIKKIADKIEARRKTLAMVNQCYKP